MPNNNHDDQGIHLSVVCTKRLGDVVITTIVSGLGMKQTNNGDHNNTLRCIYYHLLSTNSYKVTRGIVTIKCYFEGNKKIIDGNRRRHAAHRAPAAARRGAGSHITFKQSLEFVLMLVMTSKPGRMRSLEQAQASSS